MLFVAHALDKADASEQRRAVLSEHRAYLERAPKQLGVRILLSGPLTTDDGGMMIGSFFLIEADDRQAIEALFANDPLVKAEIWSALSLQAVTLRQNAMQGTGQTG